MTNQKASFLFILVSIAVAAQTSRCLAIPAVRKNQAVYNTSYPLCLDGSYPRKPNVTYPRCMDASAFTCSNDCRDLDLALRVVSANGTTVLNQISPGLGAVLEGKDLRVCALLAGHDECALSIEQIVCAMCCNPNQREYSESTPEAGVIRLCADYATTVFDACKNIDLPGFGTIGTFFPTKDQLFSTLLAAFASSSTFSDSGNFKAKIVPGTTGCYGGPVETPKHTACCDALDAPGACMGTGINTTANSEYLPFINQTVFPPSCGYNSEAPPTSNAPMSAPALPPGTPSAVLPPSQQPKQASTITASILSSVAFLCMYSILV